jgi:hypothetical protein
MRLLASLALVTVAYAVLSRAGKARAARRRGTPLAKPADVQTWEGEGGGLPGGGPGAGVKVAPAAADPELAQGGA